MLFFILNGATKLAQIGYQGGLFNLWIVSHHDLILDIISRLLSKFGTASILNDQESFDSLKIECTECDHT